MNEDFLRAELLISLSKTCIDLKGHVNSNVASATLVDLGVSALSEAKDLLTKPKHRTAPS